jgi:hypothetical protein
MGIKTHRYLTTGAAAMVGFVALGFALPDNAPEPRLLLDPSDRVEAPLADPLDAAAPWRAFPVGAKARPLVVLDAVTLPSALRSGPGLDALVSGAWVSPQTLPRTGPRLDGYPILDAGQAVAALRAAVFSSADLPVAKPDPAADIVRVDSVRLTRRVFDTDRGRLSLPAWTILLENARGVPATLLAVRGDAVFPVPVPIDADGDVTVSPDGTRLTYSFLGAAPGQGNCRASYDPVFAETATAVVIGAIERRNGHNRNGTCRLTSYRRSVSVQLSAPLDNRVAVTYAYGAPLPVRPDGTYRWYRPSQGDD